MLNPCATVATRHSNGNKKEQNRRNIQLKKRQIRKIFEKKTKIIIKINSQSNW